MKCCQNKSFKESQLTKRYRGRKPGILIGFERGGGREKEKQDKFKTRASRSNEQIRESKSGKGEEGLSFKGKKGKGNRPRKTQKNKRIQEKGEKCRISHKGRTGDDEKSRGGIKQPKGRHSRQLITAKASLHKRKGEKKNQEHKLGG